VKARVVASLLAVALGIGYLAGYEPPRREMGPGAALRAFQRARVEALGECAKYGYATQWGDVEPNSRIAAECMSVAASTGANHALPPRTSEPNHGPEL
jgi:hypothetical protein